MNKRLPEVISGRLLFELAILPILLLGCSAAPAVHAIPASPTVEASATPAIAWSAAEVAAASGAQQCRPVAALPKTRQKSWVLGFINPNKTHPFFFARDAGMAAAAAFYGVRYVGLDANNGSTLELFPSLLEEKPNLVGSHNDPYSVALKAKKENLPFLSVDLMSPVAGLHPYGVPDEHAGKLGGELLAQGLQERMAGAWKGKEIFFLGFTSKAISACMTRTNSAAQTVKEKLGLDDAHILVLDPNASDSTPAKALLSALKDHPEAGFGLIPCWDALGIDPYKAAAAEGLADRLLLVTLGGDRSNLEFLKSKPVGYYGAVEFQPFCEGWSWVETAVAILEGVAYQPYMVSQVDTQANVDARFDELYGNSE